MSNNDAAVKRRCDSEVVADNGVASEVCELRGVMWSTINIRSPKMALERAGVGAISAGMRDAPMTFTLISH